MENIIRVLIKNIAIFDLEQLMLKWGKVPIVNLDFTSKKSAFFKELIDLFSEYEISYSDVAELLLLYVTKFPEKHNWEAHKLGCWGSFDTIAMFSEYEQFQQSLIQTLNKYAVCDVSVMKHKHSFWCRISKPESSDAMYVIHYPMSSYILISKSRSKLKSIVHESLRLCFNAETITLLPLDGRCPDSLAQILLHCAKYTSQPYTYDKEYYLPKKLTKNLSKSMPKYVSRENEERLRKKVEGNAKAFGPFIQPNMEHLTIDVHTKFRARKVLPMLPKDTVIHGRLEFTGSNVLHGLSDLATESLADAPMPSCLTNVPSLGKNYIQIFDK